MDRVVLAVGVVLGLSLLLGLLTSHRRRGSVAATVAAAPLEEPYPGYFRRHGRTAAVAWRSSTSATSRGLSAQDLGPNGVVVVDVNNVRAKFGFRRADTIAICGCVTRWASVNGLAGQVLLAVDHGPRLAVVSAADTMFSFAGPRLEADDTIVFDVEWLLCNGQVPVVVVTADRDLQRRCRAVLNETSARRTATQLDSDHKSLRIVDSGVFAGWMSRSGWPEYQTNCCADGLCSCATLASKRGNDTFSSNARRPFWKPVGPEGTVDRVKLAHRAFDVVWKVASKSRLGSKSGAQTAMQWHDEYTAWVGAGRTKALQW